MDQSSTILRDTLHEERALSDFTTNCREE